MLKELVLMIPAMLLKVSLSTSTHSVAKFQHCLNCFLKYKSSITRFVLYLDYISPLVCSQSQFDAFHFDLKSSFELVPHTLLLTNLSACGLFGGYVIWFHSYVTSRHSVVRFHSIYLVFFEVLYDVTQGSVLRALFSNVLILELCTSIQHASYFLFSDYVKDFHTLNLYN